MEKELNIFWLHPDVWQLFLDEIALQWRDLEMDDGDRYRTIDYSITWSETRQGSSPWNRLASDNDDSLLQQWIHKNNYWSSNINNFYKSLMFNE